MADRTMISMTAGAYAQGSESGVGVCLDCGTVQGGSGGEWFEPDATDRQCEECDGRNAVGLDQALMMGRIQFTDEGDDIDWEDHLDVY